MEFNSSFDWLLPCDVACGRERYEHQQKTEKRKEKEQKEGIRQHSSRQNRYVDLTLKTGKVDY